MNDVEINRFMADTDAGERNNERFARVAVSSIFERNGDIFSLTAAYATWQEAIGARDGILLRLKIDGQLDAPKFRLDLTDAKFKELFCAPVTPMVVPRIITAAYLAGQPFSLHVTRKDVKANTGTFRIQQLVGVRWSDVPSRRRTQHTRQHLRNHRMDTTRRPRRNIPRCRVRIPRHRWDSDGRRYLRARASGAAVDTAGKPGRDFAGGVIAILPDLMVDFPPVAVGWGDARLRANLEREAFSQGDAVGIWVCESTAYSRPGMFSESALNARANAVTQEGEKQ